MTILQTILLTNWYAKLEGLKQNIQRFLLEHLLIEHFLGHKHPFKIDNHVFTTFFNFLNLRLQVFCFTNTFNDSIGFFEETKALILPCLYQINISLNELLILTLRQFGNHFCVVLFYCVQRRICEICLLNLHQFLNNRLVCDKSVSNRLNFWLYIVFVWLPYFLGNFLSFILWLHIYLQLFWLNLKNKIQMITFNW